MATTTKTMQQLTDEFDAIMLRIRRATEGAPAPPPAPAKEVDITDQVEIKQPKQRGV